MTTISSVPEPFRYSLTRKRNSPLARVGKSPGASDSSVARTITSELRMRNSNTGGAVPSIGDTLLPWETTASGSGLGAGSIWPAGMAPAAGGC